MFCILLFHGKMGTFCLNLEDFNDQISKDIEEHSQLAMNEVHHNHTVKFFLINSEVL